MEKKKYYVSVQSHTIMNNQGDAAFELEIEATEDDLAELQELFETEEDFEYDTFVRAHKLAEEYHNDISNDGYDASLRAVYRKLYALGTAETKAHIENMHILD